MEEAASAAGIWIARDGWLCRALPPTACTDLVLPLGTDVFQYLVGRPPLPDADVLTIEDQQGRRYPCDYFVSHDGHGSIQGAGLGAWLSDVAALPGDGIGLQRAATGGGGAAVAAAAIVRVKHIRAAAGAQPESGGASACPAASTGRRGPSRPCTDLPAPLLIALLSTEGLLTHRVLELLPMKDRVSLSHSCRAARQAGRRWFAAVTVDAKQLSDAGALAEWLRSHTAPAGGPAVARLTARGAEGTARVPGLLRGLHGQQLTSMQVERGTLALPSLPALGASLTSLTVRRCELYGSLGSLSKLTALQSLTLESCGLVRIPRGLTALSALSELVLEQNSELGRRSMRRVLPQLTQLRALSLSGCQLEDCPAGIVGLTAMTRLDLSLNSFSTGLEQLAALSHLRSLDLEETPWETLPMALSTLSALTKLHLQRGHFHDVVAEVPEVLSTFIELRSLRLGFAVLDSGLERLRPLSRLTELSLNDSGLRELPRDLTALQELEVLNLSYTSPRRGWKYLMRLPRLHKLLTGREPPWEVYQAVKVVKLDVYDEESDSEADYLSSDSDAP